MYHLILLTGHNKFLSPSYHQNVHRKIIISSNHKQACMSPQPHNALGHALQIEVVLGQVVPQPEGPVGDLNGFRAPITQDGQPRKKYKKTGKSATQKKSAPPAEDSAVGSVQAASKEGFASQSEGENKNGSQGK
jgi:hypothetical protein